MDKFEKIMGRFREIIENRHQYAREWKTRTAKGGERKIERKVVGYLCCWVPEEIIYAADMLPVRVMGGHENPLIADRHIVSTYCPHCRDCLAQGLEGKYDYLDGIVATQVCKHVRQTFFSWQTHVPTPFHHHVYLPFALQSRSARDCVYDELRMYKDKVEQWIGKQISQKSLDLAIEIYNTNRRLLMWIYELRKGNNPPLSGAEAMEIALAGLYMDKKEHNLMLEQVLKELSHRKIETEDKVRLMLVGAVNDDIEFVRFVEDTGGFVVIDDHCTGSRYFFEEVSPQEDRLLALTDRMINRPPCPLLDLEVTPRQEHVLKLARDYRVEGVLLLQQRFCEPHEYDFALLQPALEKNGFRTLWLELDTHNPIGQFRTRIEAFLETFQMEMAGMI